MFMILKKVELKYWEKNYFIYSMIYFIYKDEKPAKVLSPATNLGFLMNKNNKMHLSARQN